MNRKLFLLVPFIAIALVVFNSFEPSEREQYTQYINNHPFSKDKIDPRLMDEMDKKDRPDLAMRQNFLMTMDPKTKTVPTDRLVNAFQRLKSYQQGKSNQKFSAIPNIVWQERGPNNVGGRTRAIMWDPNDLTNKKLWAAGVAGGIWYNDDVTDVNSSWQNVNDFMSNLAVNALAYDPNNTQVFYAGTGEGYFNADAVRGNGIFRSTDAGITWNLIPSTNNSTFHYVQKIVVTGNGSILAATRNGGVQRSDDGGTTWTTVLNANSPGAASSRASDLEIAENGDIYASLGIFQSGTVHRSSDDGLTWVDISPETGSPERIELSIAPSSSSATESTVVYAVASNQNNDVEWLQKSVDGGTTWTVLAIPKYRNQSCNESEDDFARGQAWYDLTLAVHPTNPDIVFAGGINVLRSSDGGNIMAEVSYWTGENNTCDEYVHADIHAIAFRPGNPNELVVASDGGISYSSDAGASDDPTFEDRNRDYNVTQFYSVAADNTAGSDLFIAGSQDNGTQQLTTANGMSSVEIRGGDGAFCFIDQEDNNFQITSYVYNTYALHNSSGIQVATLSNDQNSGRFINPADYDNTSKTLYSAGDVSDGQTEMKRISNITTEPTDQETLLLDMNGERISAVRADANVADRVFLGTSSGGIYRVSNATSATPTATDITSDITQTGYISSIDLGATDDEIVVTFSNYGVNSVWYTSNGGINWINKDNDGSLPDVPVRWALINPNDTKQVMLATELGVWSTSDITADNPEWEQSSINLANVRCDMLQYRSADKMVVVATHGRGLYTSDVFANVEDTSPPLISKLTPASNDLEVRLGVDLKINFNEPVTKVGGNIVIQNVENDLVLETIDISSDQVTINNNVVTINPQNDFAPLSTYRVLIDAGSFSDNASNLFAGILSNTGWVFSTFDGDEPPIVSLPLPNQSVLVNSDLIELDLNNYFEDIDGDAITYEINSNSNEGLVTTTIVGSILTMEFVQDQTGVSEVSILARSNEKLVTDAFSVSVNSPFLFGQTGISAGGSPSQQFTDFSNSELETADNFEINLVDGNSWYIQSVQVQGSKSEDGTNPTSALFRIYNDEGGLPGTLFYQSPVTNIVTTTDDTDFQINLEQPLQIQNGSYWLSVVVVMPFNGGSQWFWQYYEGGDDYVRRDPDLLLPQDDPDTWGADWSPNGLSRDMIFSFLGFESILAPNVLSISQSDDLIHLAWSDNATNLASKYVIERSVDGGAYEIVGEVSGSIHSFTDPAVSTNTPLKYRVFAVSVDGRESGKTTSSFVSIPDAPTLDEPTDIAGTKFNVNWTTADGASQFVLDVSTQEDFSSFVTGFRNLLLNDVTFRVTVPVAGTYFYRVAARNSAGKSAYSTTGTIVLEPLGVEDNNKITVYPNPSMGVFHVDGLSKNSRIEIIDLAGHLISYKMRDGSIDLSGVSSGTYIMNVIENGETYRKTIVKK